MNAAFTKAIKQRLITFNPVSAVDAPRPKKFKAIYLKPDELHLLLEIAKTTDIFLPILLGASTGMRRAEVLGLKWCNVDLTEGTVTIVETLQSCNQGLVFVPPKTDGSQRTIHLPPAVIDVLKDLYDQGAADKSELICCQPNGKPYHPGTFSHKFNDFLSANNLKPMRYHDLRHTWASILINSGVELAAISKLLGHSSITTTVNIYGDLYESTKKKIARDFNWIYSV